MASGDLLKQLFRTYKDHNTPDFEAVAQQIIAEDRLSQRRKTHGTRVKRGIATH